MNGDSVKVPSCFHNNGATVSGGVHVPRHPVEDIEDGADNVPLAVVAKRELRIEKVSAPFGFSWTEDSLTSTFTKRLFFKG